MLILLPTFLSNSNRDAKLLPQILEEITPTLDGLIVESEKEGLAFLKRYPLKAKPHHLPIAVLNEHTKKDELEFLLEPVVKGQIWGLISDAGVPCVADPGSDLVLLAHKKKIPVKAIPGPSSILMTLMLSGLPSQRFSFQGYLPKEPVLRQTRLKEIELQSKNERSTQVFIEAPYRNDGCFKSLLKVLKPTTTLFIAKDLQGENEQYHTSLIKNWHENCPIIFEKSPMIFALYA